MIRFRTLTLALVSLAALLGWALPASAHSAGAAASTATVVSVTAGKPSEFGFTLSTKTVKHGAVTFKVTNKGALSHDLRICSSPKGGTPTAVAARRPR